jgi:hypothetical protein
MTKILPLVVEEHNDVAWCCAPCPHYTPYLVRQTLKWDARDHKNHATPLYLSLCWRNALHNTSGRRATASEALGPFTPGSTWLNSPFNSSSQLGGSSWEVSQLFAQVASTHADGAPELHLVPQPPNQLPSLSSTHSTSPQPQHLLHHCHQPCYVVFSLTVDCHPCRSFERLTLEDGMEDEVIGECRWTGPVRILDVILK